MGFIGNGKLERTETGFNKSKLFKLPKGLRSTNKKGTKMGLNNSSSCIPERARRVSTIRRKMLERRFQSFDATEKRREDEMHVLVVFFESMEMGSAFIKGLILMASLEMGLI